MVQITDELIQVLAAFGDFVGLMADIHQCIEEDKKGSFLNAQFNMEVRLLLFEKKQYRLHKLFLRPANCNCGQSNPC